MAFFNRLLAQSGEFSSSPGGLSVKTDRINPMLPSGPNLQDHASGERYADSILSDLGDFACVADSSVIGSQWMFQFSNKAAYLPPQLDFTGTWVGGKFRATSCSSTDHRGFNSLEFAPRTWPGATLHFTESRFGDTMVVTTADRIISLKNLGTKGGFLVGGINGPVATPSGEYRQIQFVAAWPTLTFGAEGDFNALHGAGDAVVFFVADIRSPGFGGTRRRALLSTCSNSTSQTGVIVTYEELPTPRTLVQVFDGSGTAVSVALAHYPTPVMASLRSYSVSVECSVGEVRVSIDGELSVVATFTPPAGDHSSPLHIGSNPSVNYYLGGTVQELLLWEQDIPAEGRSLLEPRRSWFKTRTIPRVLDNAYRGLKVLDDNGNKRTVVSSKSVYSADALQYLEIEVDGATITTGSSLSLATEFAGADLSDSRPVLGARTISGPVSLVSPQADKRISPDPPWSVQAALRSGGFGKYYVYSPADACVWIQGEHELLAEVASVDGLALKLYDTNVSEGSLSEFYVVPNWDRPAVFRIVTNTSDTLFLPEPVGDAIVKAGDMAVVLTAEKAARYVQLWKNLNRMTTDDGRVFVRFEDISVPTSLYRWRASGGVLLENSAAYPVVRLNSVESTRTDGLAAVSATWAALPAPNVRLALTASTLTGPQSTEFSTDLPGSFKLKASVARAGNLLDTATNGEAGALVLVTEVTGGSVVVDVRVGAADGYTHDGRLVLQGVAINEVFTLIGVHDPESQDYAYYLNGEFLTRRPYVRKPEEGPENPSPIRFGARGVLQHSLGVLEELAVWDVALTEKQVLEEYKKG